MTAEQTAARALTARQDLLSRLGLPADADAEDVSRTHGQIVAFLDSAPDGIAGWAKRRRREVDRIDSLLSGSDADLATVAPPAPASAPARSGVPKALWVLLGLIAVAGVIFAVYWFGRPSSDLPGMTSAQTPSAAPSAAPTVDAAKLAELMAKVQANPKDVESLTAISDLYYNAGDWTNARAFADKVLAVDPKNEKALIAAGAAAYNGGDPTAAEKYWTTGAKYFPNNAEIHYDLGWLYMTTKRTDLMKAEWAKVVELAPGSQMAKNVQQQVGSAVAPTATPSK